MPGNTNMRFVFQFASENAGIGILSGSKVPVGNGKNK
jgi:hypothetical protein